MKPRAFIGSALVAAFLTAVVLAASPGLHQRLHGSSSHHECAATLIASGKCEHSAPPVVAPNPGDPPASSGFLPLRFQSVIASVPSSIQEHAPPASH